MTPKEINQLRKNTSRLISLAKKLNHKELKTFVFQQKVPRDGHGPVVIMAVDFNDAARQLLRRFDRKYPKIAEEDKNRFLRNYSHRSHSGRGIVLDHHGI